MEGKVTIYKCISAIRDPFLGRLFGTLLEISNLQAVTSNHQDKSLINHFSFSRSITTLFTQADKCKY